MARYSLVIVMFDVPIVIALHYNALTLPFETSKIYLRIQIVECDESLAIFVFNVLPKPANSFDKYHNIHATDTLIRRFNDDNTVFWKFVFHTVT